MIPVFSFACFASPAVSPRAISFLETTQSPLLLSIRNAFNDPTHCDMKIIVEGKAIHVHKVRGYGVSITSLKIANIWNIIHVADKNFSSYY